MNTMKRFMAALLVLTMVLAMSSVAFAAKAKFTKDDIGNFVVFKGSLYGYDKHNASKKSNVIVKKNSIAKITGVYGKKWVELELTASGDKEVTKWFGVDKLEASSEPNEGIRVIFASGGAGISKFVGDVATVDEIAKKKIKTTGKVKMHKTPSLSGKKITTVPKGKKVKLTGKVGMDSCNVLFFEAKYGGKTGYISEGYLDLPTGVLQAGAEAVEQSDSGDE